MPQVPQGACDDVSRGDGSSSRVHFQSFHRPALSLDGIASSTRVQFWCSDYWKLSIGIDHECGLWLTVDAVDTLIGELLAAREQYRMEQQAKALMVEALGSLVCPVPDDLDDVPF